MAISPFNYRLTLRGFCDGESWESVTKWISIESVNDYMRDMKDETEFCDDLIINEIVLEEL